MQLNACEAISNARSFINKQRYIDMLYLYYNYNVCLIKILAIITCEVKYSALYEHVQADIIIFQLSHLS